MVLHGQRSITAELAEKIADCVRLCKKEKQYFLLMVAYANAKKIQVKHDILQQMLTMVRACSVRSILPEQYQFYDKWYYTVLREMVELIEVKEDFSFLGDLLQPAIKPKEVRQALGVLQKLGLVHKNRDGRFVRTDTIVSCGENVKSLAMSSFQHEMIDLAKRALKEIPRSERDISTVTLSIDSDAWERMKRQLAAFRSELLELASTVTKPDRVVQVYLQSFPLTQISGKNAVQTREEQV